MSKAIPARKSACNHHVQFVPLTCKGKERERERGRGGHEILIQLCIQSIIDERQIHLFPRCKVTWQWLVKWLDTIIQVILTDVEKKVFVHHQSLKHCFPAVNAILSDKQHKMTSNQLNTCSSCYTLGRSANHIPPLPSLLLRQVDLPVRLLASPNFC